VSGIFWKIINTMKDELSVTFISFKIIVYPANLCVNLPSRFEILEEVHLQIRYKLSIT
jgi:uncharacterized membrane protein